MTEKIKSAIQMLVNATYSDEWQGNEELTKAQHLAINSLKAWEEVLTELEKVKDDVMEVDPVTNYYIGKSIGLEEAIDIINQKLADVHDNNVGEIEE